MTPSTHPQQCPICGHANACAIALGQPAESCWCMQTPIHPEALAQIPSDALNLRCLCPSCSQFTPTSSTQDEP